MPSADWTIKLKPESENLHQWSSTMLLETQCPAKFISKHTCLLFSGVYDWLELNSAGHWVSRNRVEDL